MLKTLTRFIDFFLFTSLLTACCAVGLCMATERLVTHQLPSLISGLHILVFGSTLLVYNTPRIVRDPYGKKRKAQRYGMWYRLFFIAGLLASLITLYTMPLQVQLLSVLLGVFAFAYFLPLLPFGNRKRLRDFGWIKIAVLTAVWTTATSVLPMVYHQQDIALYPFEVLLRMVFIFSLCVLFDLRDVHQDKENNILTLPARVGVNNSYMLIYAALCLFVLLGLVQYYRFPVGSRLAAALLTAVATALVAAYLRRRPSDRGYAALADGVMLVYALAVLIT